jgi:hypothetical protein
VVLDVDVKDGAGGDASFRALEQEVGGLKNTAMVRTPTDGRHFWFRYDATDIRNSAGALGSGLDVRGTGGYVVVPPSTVPAGSYRWIRPIEDARPLPRDLRDLMSASRRAREMRGEGSSSSALSAKVSTGRRNEEMFKTACALRGRGMDGDGIYAALCATNDQICDPPLGKAELRTIVRSVVERYEKGTTSSAPRAEPFELAKHLEPVSKMLRREVPPVRYLQQGLIARGAASLLGGPPKGLKSTFALWLALSLVEAIEYDWKRFELKAKDPLRVGLIDLEQADPLFVERLDQFSPDRSTLARLIRVNDFPKLDAQGIEALEELIEKQRLNLVIIDTLARVRPATRGKSATEADAELLDPVTKLAHRSGCHIQIVTHTGKRKDHDNPLDMLAATSALAGAVDDVFVIYRPQDAENELRRNLFITGRHIREPGTYAIERTSGGFDLLGEAMEVIHGQLQKKVLAFMRGERRPLSPLNIARGIGEQRIAVQKVIAKLCDKHLATPAGNGLYELPEDAVRRHAT